MVATGILVDLRCPAKLPHADQERLVEEAALLQIIHQRGEAEIKLGELLVEPLEDLRVMVPAAVIDGGKAHARLDKPPGQQTTLAERVPAVAVADRVGLVLDGEGLAGPRGKHHRCRPGPVFVVRTDGVISFDAGGEAVDGGEE